MTFSFCFNKTDLLIICGMTLLYQSIDLKNDSKLMRDDERLVNGAIKILGKSKAPGSLDFKRIASMLISVDEPMTAPTPTASSREVSMPAPSQRGSPPASSSRKKSAYGLGRLPTAASSESDLIQQQEKLRRMTMPSVAGQRPDFYRSRSRQSFDNNQGELPNQRDHRLSMSQIHKASPIQSRSNLDFLSFTNTPPSQPQSPGQGRMRSMQQHHQHNFDQPTIAAKMSGVSNSEWETLLGSLDGGLNNVYDAIYGGQPLVNENTIQAASNCGDWSPDTWDLSTFSIGDFASNPAPPQSVLSLSDESLSSGEEVAPSELGLSVGSVDYHGQMISNGHNNNNNEGYHHLESLEAFPL